MSETTERILTEFAGHRELAATELGWWHRAAINAADEVGRLRAAVHELEEGVGDAEARANEMARTLHEVRTVNERLLVAGLRLARFVESIRWSPHEHNTQAWLDGLRGRIDAFEAAADTVKGHPPDDARAKLLAVARGYEAWEAAMIMDKEAWHGGLAALPTLTDELWDGLMRLQAMRNEAVTKAEGRTP